MNGSTSRVNNCHFSCLLPFGTRINFERKEFFPWSKFFPLPYCTQNGQNSIESFGCSECNRVKSRTHFRRVLSSREEIGKSQNLFPFEKMATKHGGVLIHHTGAEEVLDELVSFFSCISCW